MRSLPVALLLAATPAVADDAPVDCHCTVTFPAAMSATTGLHPSASLQAADEGSDLYGLVITQVKRELPYPVTVREYAVMATGGEEGDARRGVVEAEPFADLTVSGFPAVGRWYRTAGGDGASPTWTYTVFVDTPQRFHQVATWTSTDRRATNKAAMEALVQTFAVTDGAQPGQPGVWKQEVDARPLLEARAGFSTAGRSIPWDQGAAPRPPKRELRLISYEAPSGPHVAYITPDPGDGRKHPAVLWAHSGFGGIDAWFWEAADPANDQSARAFRDRGLVLMIPSWRGENDNAGQFELFFGEVDDLLAARDHLARLPFVDPERIYLAGHSPGGTLVLLAAEATDKFRAAFSIGGAPDMQAVVAGGGYGNTPYDPADVRESWMRSPSHHVGAIRQPTYWFEGKLTETYLWDAEVMRRLAVDQGVPLHVHVIEGRDHFSILAPLTEVLASAIAADEDTSQPFSLDPALLDRVAP